VSERVGRPGQPRRGLMAAAIGGDHGQDREAGPPGSGGPSWGVVPALLSDLNMLIVTGGKERTNAEYGELLAAAGLTLERVTPVAFP
jgi:hypothetical protein